MTNDSELFRERSSTASMGKEVYEEYYCNYWVNEEYEKQFQASGLRVNACGIGGETRGVELPGHRFFVALLFQPQLSSRPESPP